MRPAGPSASFQPRPRLTGEADGQVQGESSGTETTAGSKDAPPKPSTAASPAVSGGDRGVLPVLEQIYPGQYSGTSGASGDSRDYYSGASGDSKEYSPFPGQHSGASGASGETYPLRLHSGLSQAGSGSDDKAPRLSKAGGGSKQGPGPKQTPWRLRKSAERLHDFERLKEAFESVQAKTESLAKKVDTTLDVIKSYRPVPITNNPTAQEIEAARVIQEHWRDHVLVVFTKDHIVPDRACFSGWREKYSGAAIRNGIKRLVTFQQVKNRVLYGQNENERSRFVILPTERPFVVWVAVGILLICYDVCATPFLLAFDFRPSGALLVVESFVTLYFILDLCLNFFVGYFDTKLQDMILNRWLIAKQYLKTYFVVDLIASFPYDWMSILVCRYDNCDEANDGELSIWSSGKLFKTFRIFRYLRILRVFRIMSLRNKFDQLMLVYSAYSSYIYVCWYSILLLCFGHLLSCGWYYVSRTSDEIMGWVPETVRPQDSEEYTVLRHYMYSMYFIFITFSTIGYGDITPVTRSQFAYTQVLLLVSALLFAALLGVLSDTASEQIKVRLARRRDVVKLSRYLNWREVPKEYQEEIRRFIHFVWDEMNGLDDYENTVMRRLSAALRAHLADHIFGDVVRSMPFFAFLEPFPAAFAELCQKCNTRFYEKDSTIFRAGSLGTEIYYVASGTIRLEDISLPDKKADDQPVSPVARRRFRTSVIDIGLRNAFSAMRAMQERLDKKKHFHVRRQRKAAARNLTETAKDLSETAKRRVRRTLNFATLSARRLVSPPGSPASPRSPAQGSARDADNTDDEPHPYENMWYRIYGYAYEDLRNYPPTTTDQKPRVIDAPYYLGESILWNDDQMRWRQYSAYTETRCELVCLHLDEFNDVMVSHPLAYERFMAFRTFVRRRTFLQNLAPECATYIAEFEKMESEGARERANPSIRS
jgi:hypothetical protein